MENKKIDMKWCSGYCRQYWPEECAHILRIADDAVAQRFLFDLPWDMEQTVKAVTFEGKIDWRHMPEGDRNSYTSLTATGTGSVWARHMP